jgi:hypothetical protein
MPPRCVPTRRFDLESLEHRLTPSTLSLPLGLSFSSDKEAHGHAGASSHNQASDTFTQAPNTYTLMQAWSQVGLGGLFRQVVVVDHSVRLSFVYIDLGFNTSASFSEYSSLVGNLKTKGDADTKHDKGKDGSATVGRDSDSDSPVTPPSNSPGTSPATRQNQPPVVLDNSSTETNDNTPASNSAQTNSTGSHPGGQTVTTSADRNALLFTASGARNAVLPQDRLDTTTLPLTVNSAQFPLPQQQPIATGPAAAPPRVQLTLPLNGGSNARPQQTVPDDVADEPVLPLNLESADPVVPLLPDLLDQFLEETPEASVREWLFTAMPGNPFWAYALFAAAGSAGAGWLSTRRKEKRKGEPFTPDEDDALIDGFPS